MGKKPEPRDLGLTVKYYSIKGLSKRASIAWIEKAWASKKAIVTEAYNGQLEFVYRGIEGTYDPFKPELPPEMNFST